MLFIESLALQIISRLMRKLKVTQLKLIFIYVTQIDNSTHFIFFF